MLYNQNGFITVQDSTAGELPDQIEWAIPDTINAQNLNPRIYYTSDLGITYHADGDYEIGIIPAELSWEIAEGWYNFSNFGLEDPFEPGTNANLYSYTDSSYIEETTADFGQGYWMEVTEPFQFTAGNPYQTDEWEIDLDSGWNLLPNPFPAQLSIEGLNFEYFGITRNFRYMVEHGYLSYYAFTYRDSSYLPVLEVNPGDSFYIYSHMSESNDVNVLMFLCSMGTPLHTITANFKAGIEISQNEDNDICWLGAAGNSTDDFDAIYDFPALPAKPLNHGCRIAVTAPSVMYPEPDFHTLFMGSFWGEPVKEHKIVIFGQPG